MLQQNFQNHSRYVPFYHFVTPALLLAVIIGSIVNVVHSSKENLYSASLLVALSIVVAFVWAYSRIFALRAQDRAIRAEENFRHYIITGKPLPASLRMGQIIALRFASDDELAALTARAVAEHLSNKQIKQAIVNWRPDYNRA
ncbi:MAG: hypothetical protein C0459_12890 [Chitinophaga sp.]|jgi:ABC-type uncharacterized transport system permease subunit|nr:hypothetical protein [Chitinophaga sp.]